MANEMPELLDPNQVKERKPVSKKDIKFTQIDLDVYNALHELKDAGRVGSVKQFVSQILRTVLVKEYKVKVGE